MVALSQTTTTECRECTIGITGIVTVGTIYKFKASIVPIESFYNEISTTAIAGDTLTTIMDRLISNLHTNYNFMKVSAYFTNNEANTLYCTIYSPTDQNIWFGQSASDNVGIISYIPVGFVWADAITNRVAPDVSKQKLGFITSEQPARQTLNAILNMAMMGVKGIASLATYLRVNEESNKFIGQIIDYEGVNLPVGYDLCDGSVVPSTSKYNAFRAWVDSSAPHLKDNNGLYTFPDRRGKVAIGKGVAVDANGQQITFVQGTWSGEYSHTLVVGELPSHTHTTNYNTGSTAQFNSVGSGFNTMGIGSSATQSTGLNHAHNNIQPSYVSNVIIRSY